MKLQFGGGGRRGLFRLLSLHLLLTPARSWQQASPRILAYGSRRHGGAACGGARVPGSSEPKLTTSNAAAPKLTAKRKVAVVIGFDGSRYFGSQLNTGAEDSCPSVEGQLWRALVEAGLVIESNALDPKKVGFGSSSRTDRGVSAARFVVVAKLECPTGGVESGGFDDFGRADGVRHRVNDALRRLADESGGGGDSSSSSSSSSSQGGDITCFSVCKVTGKFRPRHCCNWREYEYLLPRSALGLGEGGKEEEDEAEEEEIVLERLESALGCFTGTHNWNNFCKAGQVERSRRQQRAYSGKDAGGAPPPQQQQQQQEEKEEVSGELRSSIYACEVVDRDLAMEVELPWETEGQEERGGGGEQQEKETKGGRKETVRMVRIRILGQSFFYNQIRMMVGAAVSVATGAVSSEAALAKALELPLRLAPHFYAKFGGEGSLFATAPAEGLLLVDSGVSHLNQLVSQPASPLVSRSVSW